jgi:hypothetical protein
VGPRAGLDNMENGKFVNSSGPELRPFGRPARSQSLCRLVIGEKILGEVRDKSFSI